MSDHRWFEKNINGAHVWTGLGGMVFVNGHGGQLHVPAEDIPALCRALYEATGLVWPDPDRARVLAEAGPDLEDRDFVPEPSTTRRLVDAPDHTSLKAALEGLREAWPECWALRNNGAPMEPEVRAVADTLLTGERAGLLTEDKPVDALEVAERALKMAREAMRSNGWQLADAVGDPGGKEAQDAYDAVDEALSALQRAKGGGE